MVSHKNLRAKIQDSIFFLSSYLSLNYFMSSVIKQRMCAEIEGDFVVFLIGMSVNNWWKISDWWPVAMSFPKMIKELEQHKELGYLGGFSGGFTNPNVNIQYWRSFEQLENYARSTNANHLPAWQNFNKHIRQNGTVGIWHETYLVKAGDYETIYDNIKPFGLGKASKLISVSGKRETARERLSNV